MVESKLSIIKLEKKLDMMVDEVAALRDIVTNELGQDARLRDLLIRSPVALYIVENGLFSFAGPQMRQITGYFEHELIGRSLLGIVYPDDRKLVVRRNKDLIHIGHSFVQEYRIVTKDAKIKWVLDSACLESVTNDKVIVGSLVDITSHKGMEDSVKKEGERYLHLCESANDMIQCVTPGGQIVYVNHSWLDNLGYTSEEVASLSLFEIIPADYREHWLDLLQRATSGEQLNNIDTAFIHKGGFRVPVEGSINCRLVEEKPVYTQGIFRNVSKRKEEQARAQALLSEARDINTQLQQSNSELEEFAYVASHDLQEPLRKIKSFGEILQQTLTDKINDDQMENLGYMIDGANRMQAILDDLLSYSSITTAAKPSRYVDPNVVVENLRTFELAELLAETKGHITVPKKLLSVYGDQTQIHQLFQNLIANGLKFHKDQTTPAVMVSSTIAPNGMIHFCIEDNGIGIDPEYHERIFLMFKRLYPVKKYKGTGIGLAICKKIVQRHGGEIGVKSTSGHGAVFWFTLPACDNTRYDKASIIEQELM